MSAGLLVTRELRPVYLGHGVVGRRGGVEEQRDLLRANDQTLGLKLTTCQLS